MAIEKLGFADLRVKHDGKMISIEGIVLSLDKYVQIIKREWECVDCGEVLATGANLTDKPSHCNMCKGNHFRIGKKLTYDDVIAVALGNSDRHEKYPVIQVNIRGTLMETKICKGFRVNILGTLHINHDKKRVKEPIWILEAHGIKILEE